MSRMSKTPVTTSSKTARRSVSGVQRAVRAIDVAHLFVEVDQATRRVSTLRERLRATQADEVTVQAFREIEVAHEELRVAEEELHTQADEIAFTHNGLELERRRYYELFDAAPEAYVVTDRYGTLIEGNRRAGMLFNIDPAFMVRKPLALFIDTEERKQFREQLGALANDGNVRSFEVRITPRQRNASLRMWVCVSRALGPDGTPSLIRWIFHSTAPNQDRVSELQPVYQPQRDVGAQLALPVAAQLDHSLREDHDISLTLRERITQLEAAKRLLEHYLEREQEARAVAEAAARDKDAALAAVAHELRTPLNSIAGWLHFLASHEADSTAGRRALASMSRGVRALTRLIEDLVDNARSTAGVLMLDPAQVSLATLVQEVLEESRHEADAKRVTLTSSIDEGLPEVCADAGRLQQVLGNLVRNAIKFTPSGGSVDVSLSRKPDFAYITVHDTGCGMDAEFLPKVFEAFSRARDDQHGRGTGLGLGLYLSRRLIELHGGSIDAESTGDGHGSTFTVRLPLFAS